MTPYDAVPYPGRPYPNTHPDRLAAVGIFYGMTPALPERCRVLEVGCGDGENLVPMAYGLPASRFVGIDLSVETIHAARALAKRAGVGNVTFEPLDLAQFPQESGVFDYIIAHGVYSWIPADVRDALLALIGRHLAPQGIAFVSYNTYPGCHLRQMMWEMLSFHTSELEDAQARLSEAQALVHLVAHGSAQPDEYTQPLVAEAQRMEDRLPALLYHDDLSPVNQPVYFHQFTEHAAGHGLQFLAEAAFVSSSYAGVAPEARGLLAALDPITRQQYLDFIKCRRFRESLLCRSEVAVERTESPERMAMLTFTAARRVRAMPRDGLVVDAVSEPAEGTARDDRDTALIRVILNTLREAAPHALSLDALLERIRTGSDGALSDGADPRSMILTSLLAGVIEPHVVTPRLSFPSGDRPTASAVARTQLTAGDVVASLWHHPVKIDDALAKRLLPLLDGTRTRDELLDLLNEAAPAPPSFDAALLDQHLRRLAMLGLLIA